MKVITIAHQKGGVGKTTLVLNLAYYFADDLRVAIVDTDLQGSIADLQMFLTDVDVVDLDSLLSGKLAGAYDLAVVDTPPYLSNRLPELFALSDYVLIPTKAGLLDAMAIKATISLLRQSMEIKPNLRAGIVLNMVQRSKLADEVRDILEGYDLPILTTTISQRVSYARSPMTSGVFGSDDEKAKTEIMNLAEEITNNLTA